MEGPGMSLFQGAASIHINNSAQDRLEEQEELEDQKRRNKELKDKLANAFDDLLDDDEASSVNSSGNFTLNTGHTNGGHQEERGQSRTGLPPTYVESLHHLKEQNTPESPKLYCETPKAKHVAHIMEDEGYKMQFSPYGAGDGQNNYYHQDSRGHVNGANNYEVRQDVNNENLKVLYEMRMKECQELASRMEKLDQEVDSLRARLTATVNDRDKAELSLQEAHHLLASSKHSLIELEQRVTTLTDRLKESEQEKEQLKLELRSANISLQNVQQRLHTMQVAHTHDTDALFREQQDRHREEMDRMQSDLTKAKNRLDEKENEIKMLEKRCMEKDREKEEILIEKGGTINRLASELEAAQSRLVGGEASRLKERAAQLTSERNAAREQVKELGSKLEITAHELVLCRNKLLANQKEYEHWQNTLHQILMETMPDKAFIGDPPSPGKLATLKEILSRYKLQVQKMTTMQDEISKRDKKLEQHRRQESELRARLDEQRGVETQLTSRVAVLQSRLDLLAGGADSDALETCRRQNERLQQEMEQLRTEYKDLDLKYTELEMEHDKLKAEKGSRASLAQAANADLLRELERCGARLGDTLRENGDLKNLYLQACSSRDAATRELKDLHSKLNKEKELYKNQEQEYIGKIEKEKQQAEKLSSDLASCREELERANKRISELQKEFTDKQKEFTEKLNAFLEDEKSALRKDMEPCEQCEKHLKRIRQLDEQLSKFSVKLANQESNEALMQELRGKAEFFQQYIAERFRRLRDLRSVAVNTDPAPAQPPHPPTQSPAQPPHPPPAQTPHTPPAQPPHTPPAQPPSLSPAEQHARDCDDALAAKTTLMMKEKAIREQIAEKFTLEIKTLEMNSARRLKEMEDEHLATAKKLKELLERKAQEIETLKEFILAERSKVTHILESKENEISVLIKEHNELQAECQRAKDEVVEWRLKAERYKERLSRLEGALRDERAEWRRRGAADAEAARAQVAQLTAHAQLLERQAQQLRADHQLLLDKYKAVKKTVAVYKGYINKRDAHVTNEMNRIQDDYKKIFLKMQNQLNYHVNRRVQEDRSKGKHTQAQQYQNYNYVEKITKLEEDLARLAQSPFDAELENPMKPPAS